MSRDAVQPLVLVLDDEETIRHVLQSVLEEQGCDVRLAGSAEDALALLEICAFHAALVDIVLPGMNGIDFLKEVKQRSPNTEVVVMTSHAMAETALQAIRLGAHDYLQKPFDNLEQVWVCMQRALEKRSLSLKNQDLVQKQEQRSRELSSELSLDVESASTTPSPTLTELLDFFLSLVMHELDVERGAVLLLNGNELCLAASRGMVAADATDSCVQLGEGITGNVAKTLEPFVATQEMINGFSESGDTSLASSFITDPLALSFPLRIGNKALGVINLGTKRAGAMGQDDLSHVATLADQLASAVDRNKQFEQLQTAYETLKDTQQKLVLLERTKALGQMAAGIAHDFNNALSVVLARAEIGLGRLDDTEPRLEQLRTDLETIRKIAVQGAETIKRIQDYTRVRRDVQRSLVDLNDVVNDAIEMSRPKWKEEPRARGVTIETKTDLCDSAVVSGNQHELTQAVSNLIFNAVEAMPEGGSLTFRTFIDGDEVVLEVEDNGNGMDDETVKRLFDPFFTTKTTGQGLGTSIVFGIITRHRGRLDVRSTPGTGTTFSVRLARGSIGETDHPVVMEKTTDVLTPANVLLVDDDELVRITYCEMLRRGGHRVSDFTNGRAAIDALERENFDLVITDLCMDGMSGAEVAREVKKHDPQIPVILLSGWAVNEEEDKVYEAGVDHVLPKPCSVSDLSRTLSLVLANRKKPDTPSSDSE